MTNKVSEERSNVAGAAVEQTKSVSRRRALSLLGLAAATAYVTPTVLSVNQARASDGSSVGSGSGRRRVRRRIKRRRRIFRSTGWSDGSGSGRPRIRIRTARRRRIFRSIDS
jgi:hypothetical protein